MVFRDLLFFTEKNLNSPREVKKGQTHGIPSRSQRGAKSRMQHQFSICTSTRKNQQLILFTVCLSLLIQWASGQGRNIPIVVASVGETVTLAAPAFTHLATLYWYKGNSLTEATLIFRYVVLTYNQMNGDAYTGRETGQADGSLQIRSVQTADAGIYTVRVDKPLARQQETRQLIVYEASLPVINWTPIVFTAAIPVLFATALIVGIVLYCKGRKRQKELQKGKTTFQNADNANNLEPQYENSYDQLVLPAATPAGAESHYMELRHSDQAVYGQLKRI